MVKVVSGSAGLAVAGTDFAAATNGTNGQALTSNGAGGFGTPATLATVATSGSASDLGTGTLAAARLPSPGASAKGGVQSKDCTGTGHILSINTDGSATCSADSGGVGTSSSGQVLVNSSGAVAGVTRSGNGTIASASGSLTNGHCVSIDASGNFVDAGGACTTGGGGGTVNSATSGNIAYYASTGTAVSGGNFTGDVTNTALATQVTATHLASALPVNQGGTGSSGMLTGLVRGSASAMTAAELSGDATTSGSNAVTLAANKRLRTCVIDNDTQSATALTAAQFSGGCQIPAASTIVEVDAIGGTGVVTGTAAAPTVSGTSSFNLGKYTPSAGTSTAGLLSGALATVSGKGCALPTAGTGTCPIMGITQAGSSLSVSTTALAAGDMLYVSAAAPDTAQTWYRITVHYTVN
jgi:hypothetical protein